MHWLIQNLHYKLYIHKSIVTQSLDFQPHFCAPSLQSVLTFQPHLTVLILRLNSSGSHFCDIFPALSSLSNHHQSLIRLLFAFLFITLFVYNVIKAMSPMSVSNEWTKILKLHYNLAILKKSLPFFNKIFLFHRGIIFLEVSFDLLVTIFLFLKWLFRI